MQTTARVLAKTTLVVTAVWVMGLERSCFETSARFGNASELMELQMRRICKGFPCSSPFQAVNFCVKFAKSGVKRVIGQVVAVLENSKIPGQAEVVPALAAAGIRYFRALPVEVILFGIRARSADNFCFISLVDGFIPGQFEPLPGGFLRFRKKGGDVPFGAFVKASDLHFVPVGVRAPAFRSVPRAVAGNAVNGSVIVPGQAQEPLPVEGIFLQVGNAVSHCRGFPVPFSGLW